MTRKADLLGSFSRLVLEVYHASRERTADQFQEAAVRLLKPVLGFDSSMWGTGTLSGDGLAVHSIHLHEQSPEMIDSWQLVNHEDTVAYECSKRPGWVNNAHMPTVFCERDKSGMRDLTKRFRVGNALVTGYVQQQMSLANWVSLYRQDPDKQFSEDERILFEALFPHVVEALTINRLVNLDRVYATNRGRNAFVAIADRRGAIYVSDSGFETVVRSEWNDWTSRVLPRPLAALTNTINPQTFRGARITVEVRNVGDLFFLKARPLTPIGRLSPREREVAEYFGAGRSHKRVAQLLGISPVTVRNYLQTIYGKLGVKDKAELAQMLERSI